MILLTGSNGFLGRVIYEHFKYTHSVITLSRTNADIEVDLSQQVPILGDESYEMIIHCAGKAHLVPKTEVEKQLFYLVNTQGTKNLLRAIDLQSIKPKYFVLISTVAVYGLDVGIDLDENNPLKAQEPYGHSKVLVEQEVIKWGKKNNVCISILRLPLVVGENPPGNLGSMQKSIQKGYYLSIKKGAVQKSMVLAKDVAYAVEQVAIVGGIYNLTDRYHPTFQELEKAISMRFNKRTPLRIPYWFAYFIALLGDFINIFIGKKFPLDSNTLRKITNPLTFSDSKAQKAFGWAPRKVLDFYK
ncbi:NAD-dependent epimerase/dehydratase family protein [Emticicia sp. W12TSBA100-4]|uniref:NAD-dependent epimerase/dehydratase family protein n=1 Tax=Emticicia sp. W12TSBA100-4 TaxID=3160965 RepID=UPI003305D512